MSSAMDRLRARLAAASETSKAKSAPEVQSEAPTGASVDTSLDTSPDNSTQSTDTPVQYESVVSTEGLTGSAVAFKNMLLELEEKLNNRVSNFPYLLRDVHQHLRKDVEVVTILSDEEIGLVVRGLKTMTGTILGTPLKTASGRTKSTKKMPVTADML